MYICLRWLTELQKETAASSFPGKVKTGGPQEAQLQGDGRGLEISLLISEVTAHGKTIGLVMCNSWAQMRPFVY